MTTPGGVPNLPTGALTVGTLSDLQANSPAAMRGRVGARVPDIFNLSTGGDVMSDLSPFGIIAKIWSSVNSLIANADPADITGPDDIPPLLLHFIDDLPFVDWLRGLLGDHPILEGCTGTLEDIIKAALDFLQGILDFLFGSFHLDDILAFLGDIFDKLWHLLTGGIFTGIETLLDFIQAILDWSFDILDDIPIFGPLIGAFVNKITGMIGGTLDFLGAWFEDLMRLFGFPLNLGSGNPIIAAIGDIPIFGPLIEEIVLKITGQVGGTLNDIAAWASNLPVIGDVISVVTGGLFPIGGLTNSGVDLLAASTFPAGSIAPGSGWSVDPAVSYAADGTGAGHVTANGTYQAIRSSIVSVAQGKPVKFSLMTKWSGLVASGSPISLGLTTFSGGPGAWVQLDRTVIASTGSTGSSDWTELASDWTPPVGVTGVAARCIVAQGATAGQVWFDRGAKPIAERDSTIDRDWVDGLPPILDGLGDALGLPAITDLITHPPSLEDLWTNIINTLMNPLGIIEDIVGRDFAQNIVDAGLHALTGIPVVGGLVEDFADNLSDLFGTANDAFANAGNALDSAASAFGQAISAGNTATNAWNQAVTAFNNATGVGNTLTTLTNNLSTNPAAVIGGMVNNLSGLVQNLNSSGQLAANAITGTIQRAQVQTLGSMVTYVNQMLQLLRDILSFIGLSRIVPADLT